MEKLDLDKFRIGNKNLVKHEGVVSKISKNGIVVSIRGNVSCDGCKAQSACGVSDSNDKEIEVQHTNEVFNLNETVSVVLEKQLGLKAVFWAYLFPFILIMGTLFITSTFFKEWIAGLASLLILVPYYFMLHIFNNSFKKSFQVSILKNN
ncbi:MAG: SoxR reducing system RseC family protein [Gillisia sp.]|nr:SoxR reducing system RseC family protein [Gillisia sp.]